MFSFLSPSQLIDQMMERLQSALKTLIILFVCTLMSCVTLAYLIDRLLNQLDGGYFEITRSICLLVILFCGFVLTLMVTLNNLTKKNQEAKRAQDKVKMETALETALAALVMSYVEEREEKRKAVGPKPG